MSGTPLISSHEEHESETEPLADVRGAPRRTLLDGELPENVVQVWERLEMTDGPLVLCLESIVRSVRPDGSATIDEVTMRYARVRLGTAAGLGQVVAGTGQGALEDARRELLQSVLPSLAANNLIAMPPEGSSSPTAALTISNPGLLHALLEAGLIQLDRSQVVVDSRPGRARVRVGVTARAPHDDWSQLWFAVQRNDWSTLAVVSAAPGIDAVEAARTLCSVASMFGDGEIDLIDATQVSPDAVGRITAGMTGAVARGCRLLVALNSPLANPATIPIARHASLALLVVRLGEATLVSSRRVLEVVGRERFVGAVAVS